MSALVLDAGALIAVERLDRSVWALLEEARERGTDMVVPTTALAQTWRGGPRAATLAKLLKASHLDALDGDRAKEIGVRLGTHDKSDVVDAHVACCAVERRAPVVTSDPDDIAALAADVVVIPV